VMRVLIGGVASHYGLALDSLDDLQLAVETLLAEEPRSGCDLRLELRAAPTGSLCVCTVCPIRASRRACRRRTFSTLRRVSSGRATSPVVLGRRVPIREGTAESYSVEMEKRAS